MQFVKNGPDIPERLLQTHEEGNVVFFCGSGISFPAGLPGFGGLVRSLYENMGVTPDAVQKRALDLGQFDTAVSLLEGVKHSNLWRRDVRVAMAGLLEPDYTNPKSISTHKALLHLSKVIDKESNESKTRLITTNFDRIFHKAGIADNLNYPTYQAPLLPIPKNRWDGLVYLHGLLPEQINGLELDNLVISSGDFGLAYLTERWAARFVSELFRTYTVCFVGYSLNDPVLRYMMDALAADRLLGESPPEMFAFGEFRKGKFDSECQQWKAKNVTPILYKSHRNHYYLHKTLENWAETYRDGLSGKEQIVATIATSKPSKSDLHDDYARKLAWALCDPSGIPAKRFARLNPVPPIEWLSVLASIEFKKEDLLKFGVLDGKFTEELRFNLFNRPAISSLTPNMALSRYPFSETSWDDVMNNLGDWLIRHLNNEDLVLFILKQGGILNSQFKWKINDKIEEQKQKAKENDNEYFEELRYSSPDAIVSKDMQIVWSLVLAGYCEQSNNSFGLYSWVDKYKVSGITTALKKEIRNILSPKIFFKKPFNYNKNESNMGLKSKLGWDINLSSSHVHAGLRSLNKLPQWQIDIGSLVLEFSALLKETMDVMADLNEVEEFHDFSYIHQPSIKPHPQNKNFRDWTALIDLTRDSLISINKMNTELAIKVANDWWRVPYPIFKRLALFAAFAIENFPASTINDWLEERESYWLWSIVSQREVLQLLSILTARLDEVERNRLLANIAEGPNRTWFKKEISDEEFERICERGIWLRLKKLKQANLKFDKSTEDRYQSIVEKHPKWELSEDGSDDFPVWMSNGENFRNITTSPASLPDLIKWLKDNPDHDHWEDDDWPIRCKRDFIKSTKALIGLKEQGIWIAERWREALQVWTENKLLSFKAWRTLTPHLLELDAPQLRDIAWNLSRWLQNNISCKVIDSDSFFLYFDKLISLPYDIDVEDLNDPLNSAINHPVGILTETLFKWWYGQKPNDEDGFSEEFQKRLNQICLIDNCCLYFGKVIVSSNVLSLFRVDRDWTTKNVIPWFNWENIELASMAWRSYLWSPRLHKGLLIELKSYLLSTVDHYKQLDSHKEQYTRLLTYIALQQYEEFKTKELVEAFGKLPPEALYDVSSCLVDGLSSAGDKYSEYWEHRLLPFIKKLWPKQQIITDETIKQLALLCISARSHFTEAFDLLKHDLKPIKDTDHIVRQIKKSDLTHQFPTEVLNLLSTLIDEPNFRPPSKLKDCIENIVEVAPQLSDSQAYKHLKIIVRQFE
ncbi:MAG: anti-phage defense-associated sirtuin Dsr1 [Aliiglaciecola sp.]|uniref:anti-phage defense-associated sirtuin Dsr1 n=1 Tax=Aliiglaciecola sp. TaxID=1872441 RepID=UPI00329769F7